MLTNPTQSDAPHRRGRVIGLMFSILAVCLSSLGLRAQSMGTLTGVVTDASGELVTGAFVKIKNEEARMTFLVVSQAGGRYETPRLLPGKYAIQAFGGAHQSGGAITVEVGSGEAKRDLILNISRTLPPPRKKVTGADYEATLPDGDGKKLITTRCVICHDLEVVVLMRANRERWQETINLMRFYLQERGVSFPESERDVVVDYLARHFSSDGPTRRRRDREIVAGDPHRNLPGTLVRSAAAKYVAMQFDLTPGARPHDIAVDSQGIAWVGERDLNAFGRFDPKLLTYTRIVLPPGNTPQVAINAIAVDPQDMVWANDNGPNSRIVRYDPKSREFSTYPNPPPKNAGVNGSDINTIRFYADGTFWGTGIASSRIIQLDPDTRKLSSFPVLTGSLPYGMAIGRDQMIWYAASYDNEIVKLDPNTGKLTRHKVPTPRSDVRRMAADANGNLWVAGHLSSKLIKVDAQTGKITEYPTPKEDSAPYSVDVDTVRNRVWFAERLADQITRFDPATNTFVEFPLPNADTDLRRVELDRSNPNRIWWAGWHADRIGYIEALE